MIRRSLIILTLFLVVGAGRAGHSVLLAQTPNESSDSGATLDAADRKSRGSAGTDNEERQGESSDTWKWVLGIVMTAIISPIVVKAAESHLSRDPIREKTARLHQVIELQAARQYQGLPPDGRLTSLINELTDALGDEAKGKEQALNDATSFLLGTLSSRLLEALYLSCHQVELLLDSKHSSDALLAIFDLTRLEFLRTYWGYRRLSVPQYFMSIRREDVDGYASEIEKSIATLGDNAVKHATAIGTTDTAVREFVEQLRSEISNARKREQAEHGKQQGKQPS